MDFGHSLIMGFQVAFQPINLFFCFMGVLIGTLVGVLPGLGPVAAISLLLPSTYHVPAVSAVIMLAGIYYGAMYGGSTTSILLNLPGEAASVVTCLDGYQMARKGRAGIALGMSAFGSFIAGTLGLVGLMLIAPPLAEAALKFGPPEYFSLTVLGLTLLTFLARGSMWNALLMACLGLFLGSIGVDPLMAMPRFTLNLAELTDGVGLVPVIMGLFGISEVLINVEQSMDRQVFQDRIRNLLPSLRDWAESIWAIMRGTVIGFFVGILPGGSSTISTFISYAVEKKVSRHPEEFGTGVIQGLAGPESANNAATAGGMVPLLTLGLPPNPVMAILLGAMMIHGVQPGPMLITEHPGLFWGAIASMYVGNIMLLILNLPLIPIWVRVLKVPYPILFPLILLFCLIGSYTLNNSMVDVFIMVVFGFLGYLLKKFDYEAAPLILALVLGPMMETNLRRSLLMSAGDPVIFLTRPISGVLLLIALCLLIYPCIPWLRTKRKLLPADRDDS